MKVKELIKYLEAQPQELDVIYRFCSEYKVMKPTDIEVTKQQPARVDGHVHDSWTDDKLATVEYLTFPGL